MKVISPTNSSVCYWDTENRHFLSPENVTVSDLGEEVVLRVNLNREWAMGSGCYGMISPQFILIQARAKVAHYFYHWRYHLREQVRTALRQIGWSGESKKDYIANLPRESQNRYTNVSLRLILELWRR
jgi:hypothetical protein